MLTFGCSSSYCLTSASNWSFTSTLNWKISIVTSSPDPDELLFDPLLFLDPSLFDEHPAKEISPINNTNMNPIKNLLFLIFSLLLFSFSGLGNRLHKWVKKTGV